jgi:hypothetical protein
MIIPQYWAESSQQYRHRGKQVTVRRHGWSDESEAQAQRHADERCQEALARLLRGESLARREPRVAYNGADGLPIREEVISRHDEAVITRNAYGARCLNTPDVLFVDIDFEWVSSKGWLRLTLALAVLLSAGLAWLMNSSPAFVALVVLFMIVLLPLTRLVRRARLALAGGAEALVLGKVKAFVARHPGWGFRVYRSPAGLRLMATHAPFKPDSPQVRQCFDALGADPMYVTMCLNQQCFRARLSAKPWRIGIAAHMKPRPGVWPVAVERLPQRQSWVAHYEATAAGFAACKFLMTVGNPAVHLHVQPVMHLHDEACKALQELPLA